MKHFAVRQEEKCQQNGGDDCRGDSPVPITKFLANYFEIGRVNWFRRGFISEGWFCCILVDQITFGESGFG